MAQNRIQFSLDFAKGDTSALQGLKKDIAEIQRLASDIDFTADLDPSQLKSMVSAAQALDKSLNNAFDVDLNTINIDKFNKSLAQSGFNAKSLQSALNHCGITGQQAFLKATGELMKFGNTAKQTNKFLDGLATSFLNTARWSAVSSIINNITGTIQNSFSYIKGLDSSLNDIRIVTGKSADEMSRFAVEANKAAKSLAVSTRDYTEGSLIYYQQGLDDQTVKTLTDITAKTSNVTGQSMDEISEQLTAVWNGYQVANEAAREGMDVYEEYVDKMAAVGAATASDLEELSVAMSKVASAASSMGVSFDDLNAQIATIVSVTRQAPESVGTALKTIYARIGDLKVDGVDEFGVSLGKVGEQMEKMGIQILDQEGNMRDMTSIMTEVAAKWDNWTAAQKQAAAVAMAGKRQYNNLIALFDNWEMYSDALNTSMNAAGTLEAQQEIALDSLANKMEILKATAEDLYDSLFDDESLKGLVEAGTNGLQLLADMTDAIGGLKNILPMLGSTFLNVFNQQIGNALSTVVINARNASKEIDSAKQNAENLQLMFRGEAMMSGDGTSKAQVTALEDLKATYNEMQQYQQIMTAEEKEQYNLILDTKVAIGNQRIEVEKEEESWDRINKKLQFITEDLHKSTDAAREEARLLSSAADTVKFFREENKNIDKDFFSITGLLSSSKLNDDQLWNIKQRFDELIEKGYTVDSALELIERDLRDIGDGASHIINTTQALNSEEEAAQNAANALREQKEIEKQIGDFSKFLGGLGQVAFGIQSLVNLTKVWKDESTSVGEKLTQTMLNLTMVLPMIISGFQAMKAVTLGSFVEMIATMVSSIGTYITTTFAATAATEGFGAALLATPVGWILAGLAAITAAVILIVHHINKAITANERAAEEAKKYANQMTNAYNQIAESVRTAKSEIESYYDARNALGELTTGTEEWRDAVLDLNNQVTALINKYPELAKGLDITNGVMSINEETLKEFTETLKKQQADVGLMRTSANETSAKKSQIVDRKQGLSDLNQVGVGGNVYSLAFNQGTSYTQKEKDALVAEGTYDESAFILKNESINLSLEQYNKIINLLKNKGEEALKDQIKLAEYLNIDADTAKSISEDQNIQATLMQQVNDEIANEVQLRAQRNASISQYLTTNAGEEYQNLIGSENEQDQDLVAAVNNAINKKLSANSRRATEEFKKLEDKTDEDIEELWANVLNYTKNDKGKYEDSQGNEVEFNAAAARQQLAEVNAAEKLVEQDLGSVISGVKTAMNNLSNDYKEGLQDFLAGGGTDNLSAGLRENILKAAEFDVTGNTLQRLLGLSDEDIHALGYKSGKTFKDALVAAINESDISLDKFKEQLSQGAKDAISSLGPDFGMGQSNADIKQLYSDLDEANEVGGSVALSALTEKFSEGSTSALEFSNAIKDIDWASFNNVNDAVDQLERQGVVTDKDREIVKAYADQMILAAQSAQVLEEKLDEDVNEDEYKALAEHFKDLGSEIEGVSEDLRGNQEASEELAEELLRYDSALEDVIDKYDEWEELLKSDNIQDNAKAAGELRNTYSDLLDLDPSSLSEGFLTSTENLKLLKEAVNGSEEAYNSLAKAAAKDILIQCGIDTSQFDTDAAYIQSYLFDDGAFPDLEVGASLNDTAFLNELSNMINAAGMTAAQATDYLSSMGVDAEIETVQEKQPVNKVVNNVVPNIEYDTAESPIVAVDGSIDTTQVQVPRITFDAVPQTISDENVGAGFSLKVKSANKSSGGGFKFKNSSHGGGSAGRTARKGNGGNKKKGGGKSGGGKKEKKDFSGEIDRYYDLNRAIEKTTRALERYAKIKERLSGKNLTKALKEEVKLLKQQQQNYKALIKEQKNEAKEEQAKLKGTFKLKFNKDGTIKNYADIAKKERDRMEAATAKYNKSKQTDKDKKAYEDAQTRWKTFEDKVKSYTDLLDKIEDTVDKKEEARLKEIEANFEAFSNKLQVKLDKRQFKRDTKEMAKMFQENIQAAFKDYDIDIKFNSDMFKSNQKDLNDIINQIETTEKEINKIEKGKKSKQFDTMDQAQDYLKELYSQLSTTVDNMQQAYADAWNAYLDEIDQAADKFEIIQDRFEDITDNLEYQKELIELVYGEKAYDLLNDFYEAQHKVSLNRISSLKTEANTWYELWTEGYSNANAALDDMFNWDEDRKNFYENWKNAQKETNDLILQAIKDAEEQYIKTIDKIFDSLEKELTGGLSLDEIDEQWERITEDSDKYLDNIQKTYKIQTLSNKMDKEISATKNLKAQQKLKQVKEKQLAILRAEDELTQYQLDKAEAIYDLEVKQIALENSRNNKTSMKLTRNEQGNWSYQYVADSSDIQSKQQEWLDAWYKLYDLSNEALKANQQAAKDMTKAVEEQMSSLYELYRKGEITEEEYNRRKNAIAEYYEKEMNKIKEENVLYRTDLEKSAVGTLKASYDLDVENYKGMTTKEQELVDIATKNNISDYNSVSKAVDDNLDGIETKTSEVLNNTNEYWNNSSQNIINNSKISKDFIIGAFRELEQAGNNFKTKIDEIEEKSGEDFGENGVKGDLDDATESATDLEGATEDLANTTKTEIPKAKKKVDALKEAWEATGEVLVGKDGKGGLVKKLDDYIKKLGKIPKTKTTTITTKHVDVYETKGNSSGGSSGGSSGSSGSSSGSGGGGGSSSSGSTKKTNNNSKKTTNDTYTVTYLDSSGKSRTYAATKGFEDAKKFAKQVDWSLKNQYVKVTNNRTGKYMVASPTSKKFIDSWVKFASGGYTGDWNDNSGRWAMLHQKELVLNKEDTKNFLDGINMIRDMSSLNGSISNSIAKAVANMMVTLSSKKVGNLNSGTEENTSNVFNITAEFPNAENVNEIRQAILSLPNIASQVINEHRL